MPVALRRLVTSLAVLIVAGGLSTFGLSAAQAFPLDQPPCYGASCVGQSPYIVNREGRNCVDGAIDLATVAAPGEATETVTLRWSEFCHANWARFNGVHINPTYWAETWDGHRELPRGSGYTYMVDGNQLARAGIKASLFQGDSCASGNVTCTGWY